MCFEGTCSLQRTRSPLGLRLPKSVLWIHITVTSWAGNITSIPLFKYIYIYIYIQFLRWSFIIFITYNIRTIDLIFIVMLSTLGPIRLSAFFIVSLSLYIYIYIYKDLGVFFGGLVLWQVKFCYVIWCRS